MQIDARSRAAFAFGTCLTFPEKQQDNERVRLVLAVMLLSIHIPKAAGNSFREALMHRFKGRFIKDYGDWAGFDTPEARARRAQREASARAHRDTLLANYDVIHGHFIADKYLGLFPVEDFVAFFRDPYQQTIAHYNFLLRNPQRQHPEARIFHEAKMSIHDYLEWDAFHNQQSQFLGSLTIDDLSFVGLSDQYPKSLALFRDIVGHDPGEQRFENVNTERGESDYHVDPDVRRLIERYRAADLELYARAQEIFARQCRHVAA